MWEEMRNHCFGASALYLSNIVHCLRQVRILASYYVGDEETGERIYLSGDRDILFDVTSLALNHVHSSNTAVVVVVPKNNRIYLTAQRPGSSRYKESILDRQ